MFKVGDRVTFTRNPEIIEMFALDKKPFVETGTIDHIVQGRWFGVVCDSDNTMILGLTADILTAV